MKNNTKDYNIELIRTVSFTLVVLIHVTNYYCRAYGKIGTGEYIFAMVLDNIARISVPCFFMISGALLLGREESLEKHFRRFMYFLGVTCSWSFIYYIWNRFVMHSHYDVSNILFEPMEQHLWYLYAMIPIYLVLPFYQVMCRHLSERLEAALVFVLSIAVIFNYVVSFYHKEAYYDLPLTGDRAYMFYVFIGYYLYKYRERIARKKLVPVLVLAASLLADMYLTYSRTAQRGAYYDRYMEYANPILALAAAAFFVLALSLSGSAWQPGARAKRLIDALGSASFGIYLSHIMFLDMYKRTFEASDASAFIVVIPLTIAIVFASFSFTWLLRRTKLGRAIT